MSRGISWRQRALLDHLLRRELKLEYTGEPVAWRDLDYDSRDETDYFTPRVQWNIEQATRRALRSLARRGLVELDTYSFAPDDQPGIRWWCQDPKDHVPGESRHMTGVLLTEAGRQQAEAQAQEAATRRAALSGCLW
jgi:hypothetical protein